MATNTPILNMEDRKHVHVDERLRDEIIIWLGTVRPDGRPHLVPVWFLWEPDTSSILIFSKPDYKIRNLKENPNVALALNSVDGSDVVVLQGTATLLRPTEVSTANPAYIEKYAAKLKAYGWTGESMAQSYSQPIRVQVTKVRA